MQTNFEFDVIVVGAGAAGLMAAHDLSVAGYTVCVLEAGSTPGGRMATIEESGFEQPVETGAEFVHGALPLTLSLLQKAGIPYVPVAGKMMTFTGGTLRSRHVQDPHWDKMLEQLQAVHTDMSLDQFLQENFTGLHYEELRKAVTRYANGFDLADPHNASAVAAAYEWNNEYETQYRIPGGYKQLVDYLVLAFSEAAGVLVLNSCVTKIESSSNVIVAHTKNSQLYTAKKVIVTASAGILQSGSILFEPQIPPRFQEAIQQLGFGNVIKILLQFKSGFWRKQAPDAGFILSEEIIPTWWTQLSIENNLLTGWLGGPAALARDNDSEAILLEAAINSLANIFQIPAEVVSAQLQHHKIINWHHQQFVGGGYSYVTVGAAEAKKILSHPLSGTLFFAGEAMHRADSQGTVEAALQNGRETARKLMDEWMP